jgi:hypothetical protein
MSFWPKPEVGKISVLICTQKRNKRCKYAVSMEIIKEKYSRLLWQLLICVLREYQILKTHNLPTSDLNKAYVVWKITIELNKSHEIETNKSKPEEQEILSKSLHGKKYKICCILRTSVIFFWFNFLKI